jgi:hypothetical protein
VICPSKSVATLTGFEPALRPIYLLRVSARFRAKPAIAKHVSLLMGRCTLSQSHAVSYTKRVQKCPTRYDSSSHTFPLQEKRILTPCSPVAIRAKIVARNSIVMSHDMWGRKRLSKNCWSCLNPPSVTDSLPTFPVPQGIPSRMRTRRQVRQANRTVRHLNLLDRTEHGLPCRVSRVGASVAVGEQRQHGQ